MYCKNFCNKKKLAEKFVNINENNIIFNGVGIKAKFQT